MSFGWSASDIAGLIELCHTVIDNCKGGPRSASLSFSSLRKEVRALSSVLERLENSIEDPEVLSHIDIDDIRITLQQCERLLGKYNSLLSDSRNAARVGRDVARHMAWGEKDLAALNRRISQHKQSLTLFISVLEGEKTKAMQRTLQSVEKMVQEIHSGSLPRPSIYSLENFHSLSISLDHEHELSNSQEQRVLTSSKEARASNERYSDWEEITYGAMVHPPAGSSRYPERTPSPTQTDFNDDWVSSSQHTVIPQSRPPSLTDELALSNPWRNAPIMDSSRSTTTIQSDLFSKPRTESSCSSIGPFSGIESSKNSFREPSAFVEMEPCLPQLPQPLQNPPRPGTTSSYQSTSHSSWKLIRTRGLITIQWDEHPKPIPCSLETGHRSNGRIHAIKAVSSHDPSKQLPVLKLPSGNRPIPDIEPHGTRDDGNEAGRIYFIHPPETKGGETGLEYAFENGDDFVELQSLIRGKTLLFAVVALKIDSAHGREAEGQYIRIWDVPNQKYSRCLQYFANARRKSAHRAHQEINIRHVGTFSIRKNNSLEFPVTTPLESLKIHFQSFNDLREFIDEFYYGAASSME